MGDGFVRANSEMMRCSWWISAYRSFLALRSHYKDGKGAEGIRAGGMASHGVLEGGRESGGFDGSKTGGGVDIALVGVNGAGKTTLVKLLCGFYHPDSGQILVNGRNVEEYPAASYRKLLGAVFQDMMVMAASVAENVACCFWTSLPVPWIPWRKRRSMKSTMHCQRERPPSSFPTGWPARNSATGFCFLRRARFGRMAPTRN